ncbi:MULTISPECIES: FHA domain-containing protein [Spirulina sp. CCY15215]|uniref:FHA domain-containing protein n=1 Tax=Spirulina sp. CCY15215 TaxID=2767591 RepID=UPI001950FB71|nr:FHA domain-containing protein [Spirulina major]
MAIICDACGYENIDGAEFCEACGNELTATVAPTPAPSPPVSFPDPTPQPTQISYPDPIPQPSPTAYPDPQPVPQPIYPDPIPQPTAYPDPQPVPQPMYPDPVPTPQPTLGDLPSPQTFTGDTARLVAKQAGCPYPEFVLDGSNLIVGRFDPDTGPVDIDLEGFPGEDTISRNHGEIYQEGGQWKIKDLGSTNGIFIKRVGQPRFSARIMMPEPLYSGDEVAIAKIRFLFQSS